MSERYEGFGYAECRIDAGIGTFRRTIDGNIQAKTESGRFSGDVGVQIPECAGKVYWMSENAVQEESEPTEDAGESGEAATTNGEDESGTDTSDGDDGASESGEAAASESTSGEDDTGADGIEGGEPESDVEVGGDDAAGGEQTDGDSGANDTEGGDGTGSSIDDGTSLSGNSTGSGDGSDSSTSSGSVSNTGRDGGGTSLSGNDAGSKESVIEVTEVEYVTETQAGDTYQFMAETYSDPVMVFLLAAILGLVAAAVLWRN